MIHLMRIDHVELVRDGKVIYREENILNQLHLLGEYYCLSALFTGGNTPNMVIPTNYYMGLDNRTILAAADTFSSLVNEPVGNGYVRQLLSSATGFTIDVSNGVHRAVGSIITFSAISLGWGPVQNIFLATTSDNSGYLISSASLSTPLQPAAGDSFNMRMSMSLRDCP